jgi:hypothetical protein
MMSLSKTLAFCLLLLSGLQIAISAATNKNPSSICGCQSCSLSVWNTMAGDHSCGDRIQWLMDAQDFAASRACRTVAGTDFPQQCGACNPDTCATSRANGAKSNSNTGANANSNSNANANPSARCGCDTCQANALAADAGGYSCGDRIQYLVEQMSNTYPTEQAACRQVAGVEFPTQCSPCNPDQCSSPSVTAAPTISNNGGTTNHGNSNNNEFQPPTELYCFPPLNQRQRYANVWGKYRLEVKQGDICGPGNNWFGTDTVSLQRGGNNNMNDRLTLQLKKVGGRWQGSEVRVLLPTSQYYHYGRYHFSIANIRVKDSNKGNAVIDTKLPPSIILGLFTWDDTENYATHENYNHEVDIEVARWNQPNNGDVQFLVQPPGSPQMHRFYSGDNVLKTYQQAPQACGFDWKPAEIAWYSNAGGGQAFTYNTQKALAAGEPDYTQCMPAQVEVRINVWNLYGSTTTPTDMQDSHIVEVVIDKFEFTPSGLTGVPLGGSCGKDCQCDGSSRCIGNRCTRVGRSSPIVVSNSTNNTLEMIMVENSSSYMNNFSEVPTTTSNNGLGINQTEDFLYNVTTDEGWRYGNTSTSPQQGPWMLAVVSFAVGSVALVTVLFFCYLGRSYFSRGESQTVALYDLIKRRSSSSSSSSSEPDTGTETNTEVSSIEMTTTNETV